MADPILTPDFMLSAEAQLNLTNSVNELLAEISKPVNVLNETLVAAEYLLGRYSTVLGPFATSTGQVLVGQAGFVLGMGQLGSAIGRLHNGESFNSVYSDLATSVSSMVGSAGLMLEAYAGTLATSGDVATAGKLLLIGETMNAAGLAFTAGTIAGQHLPNDVAIAMAKTWNTIADALGGVQISNAIPSGSVKIDGDWTIRDYGNGVFHKVSSTPDSNYAYDDFWHVQGVAGSTSVYKNTATGTTEIIEYVNSGLTSTLKTQTTIKALGNNLENIYIQTADGVQSFYQQQTVYGKTLNDIAWERKISLTELEAMNPHITDPNATLNGESVVISLDPTNTGNGPTTSTVNITTTTSSTPTNSGATHEGQAAADVAGGYAVATGTHSVGFADNTLNSSAYFDVVRGALATGNIRAGNLNPSANTIVGLDGNITPFSNLLGSGAGSTPINQYGVPTGEFNGQLTYTPNFAVNNNVASTQQSNFTYVDPLILDLNGDGVQLTSFAERTVLFDIDHDAAGSKEQTGWVNAADGIVAYDLNGNGKIDDISETLSEYFNGAVGVGGNAGEKKYTNGLAALKSLDSNADNQFTNADAAWNSIKVWVDDNHDGKSWKDTNQNNVIDAGEQSELKTLNELGITSISLNQTTQSGLVRDGNEVLASSDFTQIVNGETVTREALAASFIANPNGSTFTTSGTGTLTTTESGNTGSIKTYMAGNDQVWRLVA
jgi:hypothetical protein